MFAINPTILLITDATAFEMVWSVLTAAVGMATFAAFIQGYMFARLNIIERMITLVTALLFIQSDFATDAMAFSLFIIVIIFQIYEKDRKSTRLNSSHVSISY